MPTPHDGFTPIAEPGGASPGDAPVEPPPASRHSPRWIRQRARNVYQRPLLIGSVAVGVVVLMVVGLVAVPHHLQRSEDGAFSPAAPPDTAAIARTLARWDAQARSADSALSRARDELLGRVSAAVIDTFPPPLRAERDSLAAAREELERLLRRTDEAPLPASYRALGESPEMRGTPGVAPLLDTLAEVERSRADFGAAGGVDPIFVALTSRATQLGKRLQQLARARDEVLRRQVARLTPAPPRTATPADTLQLVALRDSATQGATQARRDLAQGRLLAQALAERAARDQEIAAFGVPAIALLLAGLVLGIGLGFGVALAVEIRHPHVSDAAEAESIAGARVLATIGVPRTPPPPRRRRADREVPPLVELASDDYQLLHAELADRALDIPLLAVAGDDAMVTAVVAANLAAVVARQVRTTLLVDTDIASRSGSRVARVRPAPGLSDVLAGRIEWAEAITSVVVARERTVDVLPSGALATPEALDGAQEEFSRLLSHLTRRYESVIVSAPASSRGALSASAGAAREVLVCVRAGRTPVSALRQLVRLVSEHGATVRGVVVWEREDPVALPAGTYRSHPNSARSTQIASS